MIPGTTPRRTVLRARGLHRRIAGRTLLDGVDLDLAPGEMLAVVGASGSGKSSLLHALGTLDPPDAGRVELDGEDLLALSEAAQARARLHRLGVVFQQFHLLSGLSLLDNVLLPGLAAGGRPRTAVVDRARTLLADAGVGELAERRITEASGGQLQRVAICRALINAPRVLLADEPTGALDAEATRTVLSLLSRVRDQGTAILMVTHDPAVAGRADRVQEMVDGRLRAA